MLDGSLVGYSVALLLQQQTLLLEIAVPFTLKPRAVKVMQEFNLVA
jgi:hypothetical protein